MSVTRPFAEARAALGLDDGALDPAAVERAFRFAAAAHPPEADPDGFRRVCDAYELLRDPWSHADALLTAPLPEVPPPAPPAEPPPVARGATALALLRLAVMRADTSAWSAAAAPKARKPRKTEA